MNDECGLLVNSSRGIIYAGEGKDFHKKSRESALQIQRKMDVLLSKRGI